MPLEVSVEKQLAAFTMRVTFAVHDAPMSILGASGAGKTMLLRMIAGLERPDRGRIALNGRVLFDSESGVNLATRERRVGMVFQSYALFPNKTAAENIGFGLSGDEDITERQREERIADLSARTGLTALVNRYPQDLSGGEQQRTALARALVVNPEALLLDEPLSALDTHLRSQTSLLLQETFQEYRRPTLVVTHNIEEAYRLSERMLVMSRGQVAAMGAKQAIFREPPSAEVAQLTGCKNISRVKASDDGTFFASDWGVTIRGAVAASAVARFAGIRAHHIRLTETGAPKSENDNVIPCWLAWTSETPFGMTLFLRTRELEKAEDEVELQAELTREEWNRVRGLEQPWQARVAAEHVFLMDA